MKVWRIIISLFFISLLAAPILFLAALQLKQAYVKHTLAERLETSLLKTIAITKEDFNKINSGEIRIDGKLFDIKNVTSTKNGYRITGIFDEEETALLQQLNKTQQSSTDASLLAQAFGVLHQFFFQPTEEPHLITIAATELFQNPIVRLASCYKQVLVPPPQRVA